MMLSEMAVISLCGKTSHRNSESTALKESNSNNSSNNATRGCFFLLKRAFSTSGHNLKSIYFDFISSSQLDGKNLSNSFFGLRGS